MYIRKDGKMCENCKVEPLKQNAGKFCSRKCWIEDKTKNRSCASCGIYIPPRSERMNCYCKDCFNMKGKKYRATEKGAKIVSDINKKQKEKWREKEYARMILATYLRNGTIRKLEICEDCGVKGVKIDAHHFDYNKPIYVKWMCRGCHIKLHEQMGDWARGGKKQKEIKED